MAINRKSKKNKDKSLAATKAAFKQAPAAEIFAKVIVSDTEKTEDKAGRKDRQQKTGVHTTIADSPNARYVLKTENIVSRQALPAVESDSSKQKELPLLPQTSWQQTSSWWKEEPRGIAWLEEEEVDALDLTLLSAEEEVNRAMQEAENAIQASETMQMLVDSNTNDMDTALPSVSLQDRIGVRPSNNLPEPKAGVLFG